MSVDKGLSGATAIVTGASRGFGRATALALAAHGAHVVGVARSDVQLKELEAELGTSFTAEVADVTDPSLPDRLYSLYAPRAVVLVAGAGPATAPLDQQTWEGFVRNWDVDVRQVFNFLRQALNQPLGAGATVVSMSSGAAMRGSPLSGGYAGAKATIKFLSSYAGSEAERHALDLRFVAVMPQLTPATDLGRTAVEAYAARAGLTVGAYLQQAGPTLTLDQVAQSMVDLTTDDNYSAPAYLLTVEGLKPVE